MNPIRPDSAEGERDKDIRLGQGVASHFQAIVPSGHWQEAETLQGDAGYALVGCVVAPGFEFEDFEMAAQGESQGS
jgi:predicted cupin superfamily sugar epimerase